MIPKSAKSPLPTYLQITFLTRTTAMLERPFSFASFLPGLLAIVFFFASGELLAQNKKTEQVVQLIKDKSTFHRDLVYARVGNRPLKLNLLVPKDASGPTPLVIWFHGGGWIAGSKDKPTPAAALILVGYAVASVEYRFLDEAKFPAQIHDCKAAVRWLRANSGEYNIDPDKIGAWGMSAGGHLASLLATSGDVEDLEGALGNHTSVSSRIQAACNYCGPTDIGYWRNHAGNSETLPKELARVPGLLFQGSESEKAAAAERFSPISYVSRDDPPVMIVVGGKDPIVSVEQSRRFAKRLRAHGVKTSTVLLPNSGHGGKEFSSPKLLKGVADFYEAAW